MDWVETFKSWAKPPSDTEETKASNAASMINDAIRATGVLSGRQFSVYPTGSYRNNTNVRMNSDVDIAVVCEGALWYDLPPGVTAVQVGLVGTASYGLTEFRSDLRRALEAKFNSATKPGKITFNIEGNSYRLPADVTPFLLHRKYTGRRKLDGSWEYLEGVETRPTDDANRRVVNWHKHHYDNGVAKNTETNRRFKRVTRILKKLRDHMAGNGIPEAKCAASVVPSFLIECLVYNAPTHCFNRQDGSYFEDVKAVVQHLWNATVDDARAAVLVEVNAQKALVGAHQRWTRAQAHEFLLRAWQHVGFKA